MEKLLLKLAQQLDALDEASLMDLWSKYALITERFEPTRRWEESALILSLIQAKHWKNQLFNYMLAKTSKPQPTPGDGAPNLGFALESEKKKAASEPKETQCRILSFHAPKVKKSPSEDSEE